MNRKTNQNEPYGREFGAKGNYQPQNDASAQGNYQSQNDFDAQGYYQPQNNVDAQGGYQPQNNASKQCSYCKNYIPIEVKVCPYCRRRQFDKSQRSGVSQMAKNQRMVNNQMPQNRRRGMRGGCLTVIIIVVVIFVVIIAVAVSGGSSSSDDSASNVAVSTEKSSTGVIATENTSDEEAEDVGLTDSTDWLQYYEDNYDVQHLDADLITQYGEYLDGMVVYTAFEVANMGSDYLNAETPSDEHEYRYSFTCDFENKDDLSGIEEGDSVALVGMVSYTSALGMDTISLQDCHIVSTGSDAEAAISELADGYDDQESWAKSQQTSQVEEAEAQEQQDVQDYKDQCVELDYSSVERNPDDYKGTLIKVSGTVIQVAEGWFNSVTLRVEQSDGNVWYVTYTMSDGESRILEDDNVVLYGECTGVESYTSVLGSQVTIPSMKAKYVEIN